MYLTIAIYDSDGAQRDFAVPFPYIKKDYVKAYSQAPDAYGHYVDELIDLEYDWVNDGLLRLASLVPAGYRVIIRRETFAEEPLVDFQDAAILVEEDLDLSSLQALHVAQEAREFNTVGSADTADRVDSALEVIRGTVEATQEAAEKATEAAQQAAESAAEAKAISDPDGFLGQTKAELEALTEVVREHKEELDDLEAVAAGLGEQIHELDATKLETDDLPGLSTLETHGFMSSWDKKTLKNLESSLMVGEIRAYAGTELPDRFLWCDGSAVSRETYSALFGVIDTTYGAGDGVTTFNLPDLRGRVQIGAGQGAGLTERGMGERGGEEMHTLTVAEMPSHTHKESGRGYTSYPLSYYSEGAGNGFVSLDSGATGGDQAHNTMPPWLSVNFIIYAYDSPTGEAGEPGNPGGDDVYGYSMPIGGEVGEVIVNRAPGRGEWQQPDTLMARMSEATASAKGLMSAADKARFSGGGMVYPGFTMYLSPTGNDATADGSSARPFQTINGLINFLRTKYPGRIGRLNLVFRAGRYLSPYAEWFPLNSACQVEDLVLTGANTANVYDTSIIYSDSATAATFSCEREGSVENLILQNISLSGSGNVTNGAAIVYANNKNLFVGFSGYVGFYNEHPTARRPGIIVDYGATLALYSTYQLFSGGNFSNAIQLVRGASAFTYGAQRYTFRDTDITNTILCEPTTTYLFGGPVPIFTNVTGTGAVVAKEGSRLIFTGSGRAPGFSPTGTVTKDANAYITGL